MLDGNFLNNWNHEPETTKLGSKMFSASKQLIIFLTGWIGFRILALILQILAIGLFGLQDGLTSTEVLARADVNMLINSVAYISLLIILLTISNIDLKKLAKSFGQYQSYIAGALCVVSIFAFNIFYGIVVNFLKTPVTDNMNEQALMSLTDIYPFWSLIIFGFVGPICEELTYRVGLFSFFKRKSRGLAYAITILVFAFIHFNFSTTSLVNEILNLPYYAFAAVAFSFVYERYGFAASLSAHILNNVISLALISVIH